MSLFPKDIYVQIELVEIARAPRKDTIVEALQERGAHLAAQEQVWVVAVDDHNIRTIAMVAQGEYHSVTVSLPALLSVPLWAGCEKVIIAHNHPSGRTLPSTHDYQLTQTVANALNMLGMVLEDHLILSPSGKYTSFRESNLLAEPTINPREVRA